MLNLGFDYRTVVKNSERVEWRIDDVLPEGTRLDFTRPFLPPTLISGAELTFLTAAQERTRNHVTSNAYLNLFAFIEEYVIAMALQHAHAELFGDHDAIRALSRFADEEVKHQNLFARFRAAFERDFGHPCEVLAAAAEVAGMILTRSPIAVTLMTLHLELISQLHYTDSVKDDAAIDPLFAGLLKCHWLEESQHARIDQLELEKLATASSPEQLATALEEYIELLDVFDELLRSQAAMDARTFETAASVRFTTDQREAFVRVQHRNYRHMFLVAGLTHRSLLATIAALDAGTAARVAALVPSYT